MVSFHRRCELLYCLFQTRECILKLPTRLNTMLHHLVVSLLAVVSATPLNLSLFNTVIGVSPANFSEPLEWQCWNQRRSRIRPALWEDCRAVAEGLHSFGPPGRPWIFGTEDVPGVDFVLPMAMGVDTCKVRLLPLSMGPDINDTFTPRYLSHQINRLARMCVVPGPHLGGEGGIGGKDVIGLAVGGIIAPKTTTMNGPLVIEQGLSLGALDR